MTETAFDIAERDRKYAWDYFQLHSTQRLATFNFYLTGAIAILAGVSTVLQPTIHLPVIAVVLGAALGLISFVFWKLDQRNKMLIGAAEGALKEIEKRLEMKVTPDSGLPATSLFRIDEQLVTERRRRKSALIWRNHYSYTNCFNLVFLLFGLSGFASVIVGLVILLST